MRWGFAALAVALLIGLPMAQAAAQSTSRQPSSLTPLGPVQPPRPSAPTQTTITPGQDPPAPIQSQALPSLTGPDPAYAPPPVRATPPTPPASPVPAQTGAPPPAGPVRPGGDWVSKPGAELRGLDKVTARASVLTGKVGEVLQFGSLSILVRGCAVRPPDQPADVAVFLEITDRGATAPLFRGWMIGSMPSSAVLEHPVYDVRVVACRP